VKDKRRAAALIAEVGRTRKDKPHPSPQPVTLAHDVRNRNTYERCPVDARIAELSSQETRITELLARPVSLESRDTLAQQRRETRRELHRLYALRKAGGAVGS